MRKREKFGVAIPDLEIEGGRVGFLLIHGLGGTPVELRFVAQGLGRAGYTVLCPLLHGHGGSEDLLATTNWENWYETCVDALAELREKCDTVLVGGLSVGAVLALKLAADRPDEVQGTVLFSPTLWPNGWAIPRSFQLFRLVRQKWFANLFRLSECAPYGIKDERIRRFVLESLQTDGRSLDDIFGRSGGVVFEFLELVRAMRPRLGEVHQPTLIFHPRQDDQSDISNTMKLQRKLGGLVETVVLDDSYHMVTLDRQRQVVVDKTVAFTQWLEARIAATAQTEKLRRSVK